MLRSKFGSWSLLHSGQAHRPSEIDSLGSQISINKKKEAIKIADRLTREWPISRDALNSPEFMIVAAIIYANAGEYELALDLIEEMLSVPGYLTSVLLKRDPIWDTVRNHPRFKEITSKYSGRNL